MVIRSELINIFITTDGTRFTKRQEAEFHQEHVLDAKEELIQQEKERKECQIRAKQRAIDLSVK